MSESKHTPEPWESLSSGVYSADDNPGPMREIIFAAHNTRSAPRGEQVANARRIVACVNACEGFTNEQLETTRLYHALTQRGDRIQSLEVELAALREVARAAREYNLTADELIPDHIATNPDHRYARVDYRLAAALAKLEEATR